jgi:hypothetical protein
MGIETAILGSAVIGMVSAKKSSDAREEGARKGMEAEERIAAKNLLFQEEQAEQQRADLAPWRESGERARVAIDQGIESGAFIPGNINLADDPGYRVRMQEGIDALDSSASARGRLLSGAQNKALVKYGQEQGSKEYANAYTRDANEKKTNFNILSGISQSGQNAAAGQASASARLAVNSGNIMSESGRSQNAGFNSMANARASGYEDMAAVANKAAQNWMSYKMNG